MTDILGKAFAVILLTVGMAVCPALIMAHIQQSQAQTYVMSKVSGFVDAARNGGYIDKDMLKVLSDQLSATGVGYTVKMTHQHKAYQPVYEGDEFQGKTEIIYKNAYEEDILNEVYHGSGEYDMRQGDYLSVVVSSRTATMAQRLEGMVAGSGGAGIRVSYGGRVRDDVY